MPRVIAKGQLFEILRSKRKGKQLVAKNLSKGGKVHFGDPSMPEYPSTRRGDAYCARSSGIKGKNNVNSANFWSRKFLWYCKGKKSMKSLKEAGLKRIS